MFGNIKLLVILHLIIVSVLATPGVVRGRRRPSLRTESTVTEESTEKTSGSEQLSTRTESSKYNLPSSYSGFDQETENYPFELNLIRPESQYQTNPTGLSQYSFGNENRELEQTETAEEYVAKAMQLYGSRIKNPIQVEDPSVSVQNVHKYDVFEDPESDSATTAPLSPIYEKDPVTRSYDVYDYSTYETISEQQYEPKTESKYRFQPSKNNAESTVYTAPQRVQSEGNRNKEPVGSEIPKEEILKQIEKSVIKYMKELEAEGKIIPNSESKSALVKMQPFETTVRPVSTSRPKQSTIHLTSANRNHLPKMSVKSTPSTAESFQVSSLHQDLSESLAPNVEFIYKIKARAPLQSVQTAKPYHAQNKYPTESFDHSAALKSMQEFDISHVVPEERVPGTAASPSKPKLFFNSETYHDINSLPYKSEKFSVTRPQKLKEHADYKGYALFSEAKGEDDSEESGYPIMNPYQFVFKKEPSSSGLITQTTNWDTRPLPQAYIKTQLEYDTYSPKFNNNPEGYGYQHQHGPKYQVRHNSKRGKRGGPHPHSLKKGTRGPAPSKDTEANMALRPPPKV